MKWWDNTTYLSASDLVAHLGCRHLTNLDQAVAKGVLAKPASFDPFLEILWERGANHEQTYVDHLKAAGLDTVRIEGIDITASNAEQTLSAMRAGTPIIVQGALLNGRWSGRADVLRRVEIPSALGSWSYEVVDTKLARETKGGTVLPALPLPRSPCHCPGPGARIHVRGSAVDGFCTPAVPFC